MPRRTDISSILVIGAGSAMLAACGRADARPSQMQEAARGCDIQTFAVAPSNSPDQTPYALHFDSAEPGIEDKLDCYQVSLKRKGLEPTLGLGSVGFEPDSDIGLFFARIRAICDVPDSALTMNGESQTPMILGRGLAKPDIDCVVGALRRSRRFDRIDIRANEAPPPRPIVDPAFLGDRN
ncbi:MAG TPA: hypothetical protein VIT45_13210 [Allosphingosinicella sp.]